MLISISNFITSLRIAILDTPRTVNSYLVKAKFHYASWFGASSELAPNMFGASSELASVMEFGFKRLY